MIRFQLFRFNSSVACPLLICFISYFGDNTITVILNGHRCVICAALLDNICHQALALLSWLTLWQLESNWKLSFNYLSMVYAIFSVAFGAVVDIDHFLAAKSISLFEATHLSARPFGHSIAFIVLIYVAFNSLLIMIYNSNHYVQVIPTIYLQATLSHLIRDSSRRGLWLYSTYSTPPVPYFLHLILLCALPYIFYAKTNAVQLLRTAWIRTPSRSDSQEVGIV